MDAAIGLLAGTGWSSGVNLYAATLVLGVASRAGWFDGPAVLEHPVVLAIAATLYLVEFVADKIPYVDNTWDAIHTVIRPLGAAFLGAALAGDVDALTTAAAAGGSGALALASHAAKATARMAINTSPEPVTNILASVTEDAVVLTVMLFAVNNPQLALVLVILLLIVGTLAAIALWKLAKAARRTWKQRRQPRNSRISGQPY